jgi:hypothetical protein
MPEIDRDLLEEQGRLLDDQQPAGSENYVSPKGHGQLLDGQQPSWKTKLCPVASLLDRHTQILSGMELAMKPTQKRHFMWTFHQPMPECCGCATPLATRLIYCCIAFTMDSRPRASWEERTFFAECSRRPASQISFLCREESPWDCSTTLYRSTAIR